jgi:hypothetical protein
VARGPFTKLPPIHGDLRAFFSGAGREVERWFDRLQAILSGTPGIEWDIVSKQGSALTDIETRPHSDLQNVLGGSDQYHVQQTERAELVSLDALATGMVAKTADAEYAARTILGTTGKVDVSNGNGTAGDPAVTLPSVITGPQKFGTETNYTEFEEDGTLIFNGAATVWEDDNFAAVALGIGASPPDLIAFDGGRFRFGPSTVTPSLNSFSAGPNTSIPPRRVRTSSFISTGVRRRTTPGTSSGSSLTGG